ncbi:MAG: hypothetical protein ACRKFN_14090, partial [Desulfitobacterium sp.]
PFMHKIGSNNKPKIIGQFKIAESLAHQVIQRFFVFYLLKSGYQVNVIINYSNHPKSTLGKHLG